MPTTKNFNVIIIGGSYAGLSAAMALGRSLKSVLIIDNGQPCNAPTPHSHNFLTQDGQTPGAIAAIGKQQVQQYPTVQFYDGVAITGKKMENGFEISTGSGKTFMAKKLIFATGIKDLLPQIEGLAGCWGKTVIHCPYCHGYEFRNKRTGIMANGELAFHITMLVNNLSQYITIFTNGPATFTPEQLDKLQQHDIAIITTPIASIANTNGNISGINFTDGTSMSLDALYARVAFEQHCAIPQTLGCVLNEQGYIQVDNMQQTNIPGVYACGDNSSFMRSVANAVATGNLTGAAVNAELTKEMF